MQITVVSHAFSVVSHAFSVVSHAISVVSHAFSVVSHAFSVVSHANYGGQPCIFGGQPCKLRWSAMQLRWSAMHFRWSAMQITVVSHAFSVVSHAFSVVTHAFSVVRHLIFGGQRHLSSSRKFRAGYVVYVSNCKARRGGALNIIKLAALVLLASCFPLTALSHYVGSGDVDGNQKGKVEKNKKRKQSAVFEGGAQTSAWDLLNQALMPSALALTGNVRITVENPFRYVRSNGIPDHATGQFPNSGNPNKISAQEYVFRMPLTGAYAEKTTALQMADFGVAINGVPFDPGANEFWNHNRNSGWQYEAMYLGPRLGLDQNNAHVQPNGAYHYHGIPTGLLEKMRQLNRPVLIGYAADGFPIYGPYGYKNARDAKSGLVKLKASYRVKQGSRPPGGANGGTKGNNASDCPGGRYDGSFVQDYEYIASLGDLDDCNGRFGITSEYPKGTYYYVITDSYPYIPRGFKGTPDASFQRHGHAGGPGQFGGSGGPPGAFPGGDPPGGFPGGGPAGGGSPGGFPGGGPPGGFPGGGPLGGGSPGGFPGGGPAGGGSPGGFPGGGPPGGFPGGGPAGGGPLGGGPPGGFPGGGPPGGNPPDGGPRDGSGH